MHLEYAMVEDIVGKYGPTSVSANQFYVSWNSVITLAYHSFSRTLLDIKNDISLKIEGLKKENPGSMWPKTTLGCLKDNAELKNDQEIHLLRRICRQKTEMLMQLEESDRTMDIAELSFVTFHCRTLERRLISQPIPLKGQVYSDDRPSDEHVKNVIGVMAEFDESRHEEYRPMLASNGRTIDAYYRKPHIESTLVYDLQPCEALKKVIEDFCMSVDQNLDNRYAWFLPDSWHMTVRALA